MRGKVSDHPGSANILGITPAYAGNRVSSFLGDTDTWDHPRVCGEKLNPLDHVALPWGSPPRMRGKD